MSIVNAGEVIEAMKSAVRSVNEANGWHNTDRSFGDDIALLHSEVSEMLEAYREWGEEDATDYESYAGGDQPLPKPEGIGSEAADVLIRLLDTCDRYDINLYAEFQRKLEYNQTRGYKHGGKRL